MDGKLADMLDLTNYEITYAVQVGLARHLAAIQQGNQDRYGAQGDSFAEGLQKHLDGAGAELAAAKALNRHWNASVNTYRNGSDIGENIEVRLRREPHYDLIVRDSDHDARYFVLVLGRLPQYHVVGFIKGSDAKRPEWRQNYGGFGEAYFVPQSALISI